MEKKSLSQKAFSGVFWKFAERGLAQLVSAIVAIVLARLLLLEDYAVVSVVTIFFTFCNLFISSGLNTGLIQKKDSDIIDYSTILISNIIASTILYTVMFFACPLIASIYRQPLLIPIIRVMGLTFFINGVKAVVCAKVSSDLRFRMFFWSTLVGTAISAIVGIYMALKGFGAWALVAQQMSNSLLDTVILTCSSRIRFVWKFSWDRFKSLFNYGSKLLLAEIIDTAYEEIRPLVVGIKFSTTDLAYYNKGMQYPKLVNSTVSDTLASVLFPVMTKVQDNMQQVLGMTRRFIKVCSYVIFPVMLGLFAVSDNLIPLLLTEKWAPIVIYVKLFCISHMLTIVQRGNLQPIRAIGRSDVLLKLDIIKKSIYFVVLIVFVVLSRGPETLAAMGILTSIIAACINTTANRKLFGYLLKDQILDLLQNLIPAIIMCIIVSFMNGIHINCLVLLFLQIITGAVIYISLSVAFKNESFWYLYNYAKNLLCSRNKHYVS